MTESIFDPTGDQTEKDGSRYTGPAADNEAHMPEEAVDGEIDEGDNLPDDAAGDVDDAGDENTEVDDLDSEDNLRPVAMNDDDAAEQLRNMFDQAAEEEETADEEPA